MEQMPPAGGGDLDVKAFIVPGFWSHPEVEQQCAEIKLAALWLITNSQTSILGICSASKRRFSFETGLDSEWLEKTCIALPSMFARIGDSIFAKSFVRYQFGSGERLMRNNCFVSITAAFHSLKPELQSAVLEVYPELRENKGLASPLEGYESPKVNRKDKDGEGEGNARDPEPKTPTLAQVKGTAAGAGVPPNIAEIFFHDCETRPLSARGFWTDKAGVEIRNWQSAMKSFAMKWEANNRQRNGGAPLKPKSKGPNI